MAWTVSNPVSIGMATKKAHYDALWDNCDMFKTQHGTDGTHGAVTATSITPSNLTASLPVSSDGAKKLVSSTITGTGKVVMDTSPTIAGHATIEGITLTGATGTGKLVFDTSPTLATPTLGEASGTSLTLSGLTASLPVFTDASKNLISKSVADTLTALGVGAWTDYSASAIIVGWAAGYTKSISYMTIGKIVFVSYFITGTSNSASAYFSLPGGAISDSNYAYRGCGYTKDAGTATTTGGVITADGPDAILYKDMAMAAWTTSGTKTVAGSFFYPIA
jgi:hypothetical protein